MTELSKLENGNKTKPERNITEEASTVAGKTRKPQTGNKFVHAQSQNRAPPKMSGLEQKTITRVDPKNSHGKTKSGSTNHRRETHAELTNKIRSGEREGAARTKTFVSTPKPESTVVLPNRRLPRHNLYYLRPDLRTSGLHQKTTQPELKSLNRELRLNERE